MSELPGRSRAAGEVIRQEAAEPDGEAVSPPSLELLALELQAGDVKQRLAGVTRLGECGLTDALPLLAGALQDPDVNVRLAATQALAAAADSQVVPALCVALADRDYAVRLTASQALEQLADEGAVSAIQTALDRCHRGDGTLSDSTKLALWALAVGLFAAFVAYRISANLKWIVLFNAPLQLLVQWFASWRRVKRSQSPLALSLTRALAHVVDQDPGPGLRAALEPLRQIAQDLAGQDPATRAASGQLARRIEAETEAIKDLPLPAAPAAPSLEGLPTPAGARPGASGRGDRA